MKRVLCAITIFIGCLCILVAQSHAWSTVDEDTTCWQCHKNSSNASMNFKNGTTWHTLHKGYDGTCLKCHPQSFKPVPTANCGNCHSTQTVSAPLFGPFPCYWPDGHSERYTCIDASCHPSCVPAQTCSAWNDVIAKYNAYVRGVAAWAEVISCYSAYVAAQQ